MYMYVGVYVHMLEYTESTSGCCLFGLTQLFSSRSGGCLPERAQLARRHGCGEGRGVGRGMESWPPVKSLESKAGAGYNHPEVDETQGM